MRAKTKEKKKQNKISAICVSDFHSTVLFSRYQGFVFVSSLEFRKLLNEKECQKKLFVRKNVTEKKFHCTRFRAT